MSSFDRELEEELEKLRKKKQKDTVTPETSKPKSFDEQLELELEHFRKYGTNTEEGRKTYLPSSSNGYTTSGARSFLTDDIVHTGSKDIFDSIVTGRTKEQEKDIGPVKKESKIDFFQKGTLSDGYQFGDLIKANLATTADMGINLVKGAGGIVEGVADLILYGASGVANAFGNKSAAKALKKGASTNLMDELFKKPDNYLDQYSYLGRTSDSIVQGLGQVGAIMATGGIGAAAGLGSAGVTALTTGIMGASGMGSGMGEAYKGGASDGEAVTYGVIAGAADALTELMFGGLGKGVNALGFNKGLLSVDDLLAKKVSNLFSNQIAKNFAQAGIKATAEGVEEVVAGIAQAWGKGITYSDKEFGELLKDENLLEQFIVGAVASGFAQAPSLHVANKTKADFISGQTQEEQDVVKKEVENRISEMEKDGKKLTSKEKAEIEAQVEEALERGEISLDTIEEVLGGDDFTALRDTVTKENEALAELAELYEGDELKAHADSLLKDSKRGELQEKLYTSVFEKAKGSRLGESYRHLNKFQADLTKYSEKEQAIVKKAVDSGVLNDSRKTHEFVDFVAKVSSYSGIDFEFTNNQRLKETGFVFNGNTTNGFYDPKTNKVVINSQAKKYLHSLVGHEVTHALEGSGLYESVEKIAFEYAKQTKEYKNRLKAAHDMYSGKEGYTGQEGLAKIKKEAVADMIGDYLFTDSKFVSHLSVSNPNVFQRIYNEVKHLWKMATAGSQQAKQLEQLKYTFEKALREKGKDSATAEGDVRLSVAETTDGRSVAVVENDILSNIDTSKWDKETKKAAQKAASNELKKFADGFVINGVEYIDSKKTRREYTKSDYSEALAKHDPEAYLDKMRAASVVDDVVRVATDWTKDGKLKYERKDFVDFVRGKTLIKSGDRTYRAVVLAGITKDGKTIFYDVEDVYPDSFEIKESESYTTVSTDKLPNSILKDSDTDTVTQNGKNVKYSLSPQQEEYFKDSVVRDENGNLKVMYHGTSRGGHTMFDPYGKAKYGLFGLGSYFTDNKEVAQSYTKKGKGTSPQVYETYLNITNPMDMDAAADPKQWQKAFPDAKFPESGTNEQFYRAMEEYFEDNEYVRWEAEEAAMDAIMGMGYDGITHIGGGRFNKADDTRHRVYIAFQPEQIKDVGNASPTSDPDIRYSLSQDSDGNKLTQAQQEYFRSSKMRDDNGKLKVMYHGSKDGGFHVFDKRYSDDHTSFFFVDSNDVASSYSGTSETYAARSFKTAEDLNQFFAEIEKPWYEVVEENGKFVFSENGDFIAESDTALGIYEEFCDWEGVGYGDVNYKVYLNLTNPLEVDANGREWDEIQIPEEHLAKFNESVFGKKDSNGFSTTATTRNFSEYANAQGYDGVIFKNILDVGGYGGKYDPHTVAIAFDGSQVKSVANENPTTNKDIRFSLSKAVEETKDLVALHNLTADKLTKSLELGGLPMPSLAITKADIPHSNFGDITLIFDRKTIDPKASKKNKVYSADAWTPVFPRVEYEADSKVGNQISRRLRDLEGRIAGFFQQDLRRLQYGFDDYLNRQGGEEGLIQHAMENYGLKAAYLEEQGQHIEEITKQEEVAKEYNPKAADKYQKILEILGVTTAEEIRSVNLKDARDNHGAELDAAYPGVTQSAMRMARVFNAVSAYLENKDSGPVYNTVTDGNATKMAVDKALDADGFEAWTRNLFAGIVKDSGIYNNKELFTPSGNRRTFKQTHIPVTLENIVKAMAGQNNGNSKNVSGFNGIKTLRAATAETFKSVDEMHQRKDRLQNLTQEEVDAINDALQSRLFEIMHTIDNEGKQSSERNPYIRLDSIGETITEIGESGKYNVADIQNTFRQYGKEIGDDTVLAVKQLLYDVTQMPVNIFEAKPQRVVGFDEAKVFVIPNNVDTKLKQELLNRGYNIAEYDPKVEGDRQRVVNQFEELKFSLADAGDKKYGDLHLTSEEIRYNPEGRKSKYDLPIRKDIAPVAPAVQETPRYSIEEMFPDEVPAEQELRDLLVQQEDMEGRMLEAVGLEDFDTFNQLNAEYTQMMDRISKLEAEGKVRDAERIGSLEDADAPPEMSVTRDSLDSDNDVPDPMMGRLRDTEDFKTAKPFMAERPEVKPFFQDAARAMLGDVGETIRGERLYSEEAFTREGNEAAWTGVSRQTTADIAELRDNYGYSYNQIENALKAIIEDRVTERHLAAKNIEFMLNDRMLYGYTDMWGKPMPANQEYIQLAWEMSANDSRQDSFDSYMESVEGNLPPEAIGPVVEQKVYKAEPIKQKQDIGPVKEKYEAITPKKQPRMVKAAPEAEKIAKILEAEPTPQNKKNRAWARFKANVLDKGAVFEDLSLKTRNRELMGKWNFILGSEARAQRLMGTGTEGVKSLNAIRDEVESSGKAKQFYDYLYHKHNVDRMQLEERYEDMENKPVFGYSVTAEKSQVIVDKYEISHPAFKQYAQDIYDYMNHLRKLMVDNGVISQDTADLWADMYPNYVPIRRAGKNGAAVNVPLDTGRTGVNAPVKKATGGNMDILPLFDTMALRTVQTYKAIAKNSFGVELKNVLGTIVEHGETSVDGMIDSVEQQEGLLQEGKNGAAPTFTVFENGEKVTFEITEDMYDALKPVSEGLAYTNKVANTISNFHRGLLTEYNPVFMLTNAIKDTQDILINSQHPGRTYLKLGEAYVQMLKKGYWYTEYMENGGEQNTYFDDREISFDTERKGVSKLLDIPPISTIGKLNNFIEMTPRLAEYIASREAGRSIEVSMLDAARVTTNFQAGGDLTKFLNRNGATFLNASVQGVMQNVRNFREAKANGWKGWANLATKFAVAGLPAVLLNGLLWDDDEEYEELSDYVKQNYYIVAKYGDGKFVRIPKGRTIAVIQAGIEQIGNAVTGDDEVDLNSFLELVVSNLAPNNPIEDNILAPIIQVKNNETWYGEDLVPTRLQDLPAAEQYDESTDKLSKWLGEKLNVSPVKINYLLDQYTGGLGDTFLPMLTPEAESGDNSAVGNLLAPLKSKFTTDSVMNNQNVSDFYDTKDELTTAAKSAKATDTDVLKNKYMNSVNADLSELYKQKREIQNSGLPDSVKYQRVRAIQQQIVDLTKESLDAYDNITMKGDIAIIGNRYFERDDEGQWQKMSDSQVAKYKATSAAGDAAYATDGTNHYRWYEPGEDSEGEPGWRKVSDKELERQNEVTSGLGITPEEYWAKQEEYSYAYDHPENYAVAKSVGGYEAYRTYSSELYEIKADKDENGKSISGSRKDKVIDYVSNLDIDYGMKLILFKSEYNADDTYNNEIIDYLNSRSDLSFDDIATILRKIGFEVSQDGTITW